MKQQQPHGSIALWLSCGVLGRVDDMLIVHCVNVYPSVMANILHRFPGVTENRVIVTSEDMMDEIALQVQCPPQLAAAIPEE